MKTIKYGKTKQFKQRFQCKNCKKIFIWKESHVKKFKEQRWFKLWVTEGYSARQLVQLSGHSRAKIFRIIHHWLNCEPPVLSKKIYRKTKYVLFDGTYFHKDGCLVIMMDAVGKRLLDYWYIDRENYPDVYPRLITLRLSGLMPKAITLDGHKPVTQAVQTAWPPILVQRCLFHIENQGLMWIRRYPKSEAGKALRLILKSVTSIHCESDQQLFLTTYKRWHQTHNQTIKRLPKDSIANKDLKRTVALIDNALPNMFHFIKDRKIANTTNLLENFYSQLKHQYQRHRGLSRNHKIAFLYWYCYFKNLKNTNTS